MRTLTRRVEEIERERQPWRGPLVVFEGDDEDEVRRAIAEAGRIGRPVIRWPVARSRLEAETE